LYLSYVLPSILGALAYGKTWTVMGPWSLGRWYRPLAWLSAVGCAGLIAIGMGPPNERSVWVLGVMVATMTVVWFAFERQRFPGPPVLLKTHNADEEARAEASAVPAP